MGNRHTIISIAVVFLLSVAGCGNEARLAAEAEKASEFDRELLREIALTSDDSAEANTVIRAIKDNPKVLPKQMLAAYRGVSKGAPDLALARRLELTNSVSRIATLGLDFDLAELGRLTGAIATLPPTSDADAASNKAFVLYKFLRDKSSQLTPVRVDAIRKLIESGAMAQEEALGIAAEAIREDHPDMPIQLWNAANKNYSPPDGVDLPR